jgi:hypothetical protein
MTWRRVAIYYLLGLIFGGYYLAFQWNPRGEKPLTTVTPRQQSRFVPIARDDVQEITFRRDDGTIICRRNGEIWDVVEPSGARVSSGLVSGFLENLTLKEETQVIDDAPSDLTPYGLDHPSASVVVKGEGEIPLITVFIGTHNPATTAVYARKDGNPEVVLLGYTVKYYAELIFEAAGFGMQAEKAAAVPS